MSTTKNPPQQFRAVVRGRTEHHIHVVGVSPDEGHEAIVPIENVKSGTDRPLLIGGTGEVRVFSNQKPFFRPGLITRNDQD